MAINNGIRYERSGLYDVIFYSYCGTRISLLERADKDEATEYVKRYLRVSRMTGRVYSKIDKLEWEFFTSEDAVAVSPHDGILRVRPRTRRFRRLMGRKLYLDY